LSDFQFENQRRTFDSFGYAADPSVGEHATPQIVGDQVNAEMNQGMTIFETHRKHFGEKRKKEKNNNPGDVEGFQGPWAPFVDEITVSRPSEVYFINFLSFNSFIYVGRTKRNR
jgi:pre-mRNA-processing factor 17